MPCAPHHCSEVFGLQRFRECELIHGRWAMLACLGALVQEAVTGDSWVAAQVRGGACVPEPTVRCGWDGGMPSSKAGRFAGRGGAPAGC